MKLILVGVFCVMVTFSAADDQSNKNTVEKRHVGGSTNGGWGPAHCWDDGSNLIMDPFCALYQQSCTDAPEISHGSHSQNYNRSRGSNVNYVCDDGYHMDGPEVIVCNVNTSGAFWSTPPTCIPQCSNAPNVTNGWHNETYSRLVDSNVNYVCDEGYIMEGVDVITCEQNVTSETASWSTAPTCVIITCPAIPDIENGYHDSSNTTELGTIIQYYCNENYIIENTDTITCVRTDSGTKGQWTKPLPSCKEMLCRPPTEIKNGEAVVPNPLYVLPTEVTTTTELPTTTTDVWTTTADEASTTDSFNDNSTQVPGFIGNTTEPDVNDDLMTNTTSGIVPITITPDQASKATTEQAPIVTTTTTITTTTDFITTTLPTTILTSSTTQGPSAIGPYMATESNATFQLNETITYRCKKGYGFVTRDNVYKVRRELDATCIAVNNTAVWSTTISCVPDCLSVPEVRLANHTIPINTLQGSSLSYTCEPGHHIIGEPTVTCLATGSWSQLPQCTECVIQPIDIVFIIDASGSLGVGNFRHALEFVVDIVQRFPIETSNFGLLTFAFDVHKEFGLDSFTNDTAGLINRTLATKYMTGGTYTFSALQYARTRMFQEQYGMRPNVIHTAIIVTDGQSSDFNETVHQAELLKAAGVTIYSVGIGITNQEELRTIASKPEYVFTVDNYDLIDQIAGPLAEVACSSSNSTVNTADEEWE